MDTGELEGIYEIEEGIEHRMQKAITHASSYEEYLSLVKTKRYTWTRLQRMNTHLLMSVKKKTMHELLEREKSALYSFTWNDKERTTILVSCKKRIGCTTCE